MVHTVEDNPAEVLLGESHLHDEPKGRQNVQTLSHRFFVLQVGITFADQLVLANIFSTQSMKLKDMGKYMNINQAYIIQKKSFLNDVENHKKN